jgi:hypothetical protein
LVDINAPPGVTAFLTASRRHHPIPSRRHHLIALRRHLLIAARGII